MSSENIDNRIITVLVMLTPQHIFLHCMITWYKYNLHKTHLLINFHSNNIFKSSSTVLLTNYNKYFFLRKMRLSIYPHFFSFPSFSRKTYIFSTQLGYFWCFRGIQGFREKSRDFVGLIQGLRLVGLVSMHIVLFHFLNLFNVACSGVKALCPSSHIQAHIRIPDTAKGIGWIIRDGRAE